MPTSDQILSQLVGGSRGGGGGAPAPAPAPMPAPGGQTSDGILSQLVGGSGPAGLAGATTASGATRASSGGGGIGGFLGGALHLGEKLGGEAVNIVKGIPQGLWTMGGHAAASGWNTLRTGGALLGMGEPHYLRVLPGESLAHYITRDFPILSDVAGPTVGAGRSVAGVAQMLGAPGHGFADETSREYSQDPLGKGLSDVLGATVVAAPAAGALERAGLGDTVAGRALAGAAAAGHAISALPVKPYEFLGSAVGAPLIGRLGDINLPSGQTVAGRIGDLRTAADLKQRYADFYRANLTQPSLEARGALARPFTDIAKLLPNPDEQAAAQAILRNETGLLGPALEQAVNRGDLTPQEAAATLARVADTAGPVSPEALRIAENFRAGTLPAEQAARLSQAVDLQRAEVLNPRQVVELTGANRLAAADRMSPEQLGTAPLSRGVEDATAKPAARLTAATRSAEAARVAADRAAAAVRDEPVRLGMSPTARLEGAVGPAERAQARAEAAGAEGSAGESAIGQRAQQEILDARQGMAPREAVEARIPVLRMLRSRLGEITRTPGEDPITEREAASMRRQAARDIAAERRQVADQIHAEVERETGGQVTIPRPGDPNYGEWQQFKNDAGLASGKGGRYWNPEIRGASGNTFRLFTTAARDALTRGGGEYRFADLEPEQLDRLAGHLRALRQGPGDAIPYHLRTPELEALLSGSPADAAKALTELRDDATRQRLLSNPAVGDLRDQISRLVPQGTDHPGVLGLSKTPDLLRGTPEEAALEASRQRWESLMDKGVAHLSPVEAHDFAIGNAQDRVGYALALDAEGGRPGDGYRMLNPDERRMYQAEVASTKAGAMSSRLADARDQLIQKVLGKGRAAGRLEGARLGEAARTERVATKAEAARVKAQAAFDDAKAKASEAMENTPARLRPMRTRATQGVEALRAAADEAANAGDHATAERLGKVAAEIPTSLKAIADAHLDAEHLIGQTGEDRKVANSRVPTSQPRLAPGAKAGASYRRAAENVTTAPDVRGQYRVELARRLEGLRNSFARQVDQTFGTTAKDLDPSLAGLKGQALHAEMAARGYSPWEPSRTFTEGRVPAGQVGEQTRFLPTLLLKEYGRREAEMFNGPVGRAFDRITRVAYKEPLAISPTMQARRLLSDVFMAHTRGDMSLGDIIRTAPRAVAELRNQTDLARAAQATGLFEDERAALESQRVGAGRLRSPLGAARDVTMRASNWVDNAAKVAVMLDQLGRGASRDEAIRAGIRAIGDYSDLSPFERGVLGRIFPVYPWAKQVTQAVAGYAADHPLRTLWTLHLGDLASQNDANRPGWLRDSIDLGGGRFLSARNFFPPELLTATPGGFLNPVLKTPVEMVSGMDPNTLNQLTRPPTQKQTGAITSAGEAAYLAAKNNPLGSLALGFLSKPELRYNTGEPRFVQGRPVIFPDDTSLPNRLLNLAGLGTTSAKVPPLGTKQAPTKTQRANNTAARNYRRYLSRYGSGGLP